MLKLRKRISNEDGFTLIEIIFVVIILAILAGVALVSFGGMDKQAKDSRVQADFRTIATALKGYKAITGSFPAANLTDLTSATAIYTPLLDSVPNDPYTNAPYGYTNPDAGDPEAVDVTSGSAAHPSIAVK